MRQRTLVATAFPDGRLFRFPDKTDGYSRSFQQSEHWPCPSCIPQLPQIILLPMVVDLCNCFLIAAAVAAAAAPAAARRGGRQCAAN